MSHRAVAPILLGIAAALAPAPAPARAQQAKPDESRFTPVVLVPGGELNEPENFEVLRDGRVLIQERKTGAVKMYDPGTRSVKLIGSIPVNHTYTSAAGQQREAEEGLFGMTVDPDFEHNGFIYLMYAHPTVSKHVLSRFKVEGDSLVTASEKVVLEYTTQRETCCHTGGGMTWDRDGNLYVTVGNNTGNNIGSQTDQRAGMENWDDQRGSANTNDLRGKILRIHPEPDGSYTIPAGNLFAPGTPGTRPEIYTMGHRNAWRPSLDSRTGFLYWGEIGPDAAAAAENTVEGYDEFNQARGPGYYGWPYFIGPGRAYPITDYATGKILPPKDPAHPVNDSRNNTGLRELPPARRPLVAYPYAASERFPQLGSGGRCAVGGPVYHRADRPDAARPWPAYFEGKWLVTDCSRNWIVAITLDGNSDFVSLERILPNYRPVEPIDMKFGPDGDLYVLEYGSVWFNQAPDSKLVRIEYNGGNRAPEVELTSSATGGTVPFRATLSSEGTRDPDGDDLRYEWSVVPEAGGAARTFDTASPIVSFDRAGVYTATLTAIDPSGAKASRSLRIVAGNEPPAVAIDVPRGNRTFYFPGLPLEYMVHVTDREDGSVPPERVALSIDYLPEGLDTQPVEEGDRPVDAQTRFAVARAIMRANDCQACHQLDVRSAGPSFHQIAAKYRGDADAPARLVQKVRQGGSGVWGEISMPAHPNLSVAEASALVRYILSTNDTTLSALPLSGSYTPEVPAGDDGRGSLLIRAVYTDRGAGGLPSQTAERALLLRSPQLDAGTADVIQGAATAPGRMGAGPLGVKPNANGYVGFRALDLTGVKALELAATACTREGNAGGTVEVRLDSPTGPIVGRAEVTVAQPAARGARQRQDAGAAADRRQEAGAPAPAAAGAPRAAAPPPAFRGPAPIRVELSPPVRGSHDLYLVFRNEKARPFEPLMSLSTIRFLPE